MQEKVDLELRKLIEIGTKKGSLNEDDIMYRMVKNDANADEIDEVMEQIKRASIKIIKPIEVDIELLLTISLVSTSSVLLPPL